jgi:hypothetical protein
VVEVRSPNRGRPFADVLLGVCTCQAASDEEDEDEFDDMQMAEEALVEAAADTLVPLVHSFGAEAFMEAWKVRIALMIYYCYVLLLCTSIMYCTS